MLPALYASPLGYGTLRTPFVGTWQPDNGAHVATLPLVSGPSGPRPDLDVAEGHPVAAALACMVA